MDGTKNPSSRVRKFIAKESSIVAMLALGSCFMLTTSIINISSGNYAYGLLCAGFALTLMGGIKKPEIFKKSAKLLLSEELERDCRGSLFEHLGFLIIIFSAFTFLL
ncbi:hypothetical protein [Nitrincola sp. MINF-07-Sa-05]|uniref:hypothetical protein n=1 Tax=Nitrincola salilacus TaxID=3400273 RepID=UPI0039182039